MKKKPLSFSNILFAIFIILLIIPQTRTPIQVAINKVKLLVWSPSIEDEEDQIQIEAFGYALKNVEGFDETLEIGKGKITFISYWATWCPPCLAELPSIEGLYQDYGDKINFLLITNEKSEVVMPFMNKKNYKLPVYIAQMNPPQELAHKNIPTSFLIDAQGKIIIKETGSADWNSKKVRRLLDGLLKN